MKGVRARLDYFIKHNSSAQWLYTNGVSLAMRTVGAFVKSDKNLVLFSAHGRGYNDSPRAIYEAMRKDARFAGCKYVWAVENPEKAKIEGCEVIAPDTPKYFLTTLKAGRWVTCVNIERGLRYKKRTTKYLNTWHGIPFKTIGNAAGGRHDFDFSRIDYFCCSGDFDREIYVRDFGVRRQSLLNSGLPRNDRLYLAGDAERREMRKKLNIPDGKMVILYAPTWRDSADGGASYALKPPIDMALWEKRLADKYVLMIRAHAYTDRLEGVVPDGFVRDASDYPDVNDLMIAADILITDYSSIAFDYAILEKPIICFGYDYDEYKKSRGLYEDLRRVMPGGVLTDGNQVLDRIENIDFESERAMTAGMKKKYLQYGGSAVEICLSALAEGK